MKNPILFLIDDDADDRDTFIASLDSISPDIICIEARDGLEALEMIELDESFIPDYIFLDLNMPRINGKECLTKLRDLSRLDNTPIYICSTSSSDKDVTETLSLGATDYIVKPADISELIGILSAIMVQGKV